jgi:peptidoglycan/xylan/chitin deacetylase (PgdA/CDA1 family)
VPDSLTNPNREPFGGPAAPGRPADPLPSGSLDALPSQAPRSGPSALRERELVPREIRRTPEGKQALMEAKAFQEARRLRLAQNRIYYTTFNGGSPYEKLVALTFDDGPDPKSTLKVLAALRRAKVPATFFVIGRKVDRYPEIVRQTAAEGHDLGNHTYHHYDLSRLDDAGVRFEIERTSQSIARVVGGPTRWFRAPGCRYNDQMLAMLTDLNMIRVDTTNNSGDWNKKNSLAIIRRTLDRLAPGDVILCHDRLPLTVQALPELIRQVRERGFRFVPLAELALRAQLTGYFPPFQPRNQGIVIEEPRRKMQRARAKRRMRSPVNVSLPTPTPVSNVSERRSSPKLAENVTLPTPTTLTPSASNGVTKPVRVYPKARQ